MTTRWNEDAEPTTQTTPGKVTGIIVDPSDTGPAGFALFDPDTGSYAVPDGGQSDLHTR